jgi:hypothetical protein
MLVWLAALSTPSYMKVRNAADIKLIAVSFIVCSKLPCVSHLNIKCWNCLNRELKLKLANTIVGPLSFDSTGNWYFELATYTLNNSGTCIYLRIDWPARTPVILLMLLYLSLLFSLAVIVLVTESEPNVSCYVTGTVVLVSSCNLLWCLRLVLVPTSLLAVLPSIQGCNTVHYWQVMRFYTSRCSFVVMHMSQQS